MSNTQIILKDGGGVYRVTTSETRIGNLTDLRSRLNTEPKVTRLPMLDKAADNPNSSKQIEQAGLNRLASVAHIHDDNSISLTSRLKNIFVMAYVEELQNIDHTPKAGSICIKPNMFRNHGEGPDSNRPIGSFPMHITYPLRDDFNGMKHRPTLDLIRFYGTDNGQELIKTYLIMSTIEDGGPVLWAPITPNTSSNGDICMGNLTNAFSTMQSDDKLVELFLTPSSWNSDLYTDVDTQYIHWEQDADGKIEMVFKSNTLTNISNTIALPKAAAIIEDMNHEHGN